MILPGVYTLTKTIKNPNADRRFRSRRDKTSATNWLMSDEWKAGDRFMIRAVGLYLDNEASKDIASYELVPFEGRTYSMEAVRITTRKSTGEILLMRASKYDDEGDGGKALRALLDALKPEAALDDDDALHTAFKSRGRDTYAGYGVVRRLLATKKITIADVEAALDHEDDE